jgi:hypothetical protein
LVVIDVSPLANRVAEKTSIIQEPNDSKGRGGFRSALRSCLKWRPRFRLRDLMWLCLLSAVLMTWYRDRQSLLAQIFIRTGVRGSSWSIDQLLGVPNTPSPGDQSTAWASRATNSPNEWVIVEFLWSSNVAKVEIVETYNPGAVRRVCSVSATGHETELWKGVDPTPVTAAMGRSIIPIPQGTWTRRIKIYLDSAAVPGWNEIDAIALHDRDGTFQWANNAWASTSFGENREMPRWFWP